MPANACLRNSNVKLERSVPLYIVYIREQRAPDDLPLHSICDPAVQYLGRNTARTKVRRMLTIWGRVWLTFWPECYKVLPPLTSSLTQWPADAQTSTCLQSD